MIIPYHHGHARLYIPPLLIHESCVGDTYDWANSPSKGEQISHSPFLIFTEAT